MENNYIDMIEETPTLLTKKCKMISLAIKLFLQTTAILIALFSWYLYDYFIAIGVFLLSFIVMGIVRSKIIHSVIPPKQREYDYDDKEIADWFTAKEICLYLN